MKRTHRNTAIIILALGLVVSGCGGLLGSAITHTITPVNSAHSQIVTDCNTGVLVTPTELIQPPIGCDGWNANRYERPFNADSQDEYFPDLDILQAELGTGAGWFFLRLELFDLRDGEDNPQGTYAIELDLDQDYRGDALVLTQKPRADSGEWQVAGVQVWEDTDQTVGNTQPSVADHPFEDDGYDKLLFNEGANSPDPDLAWSRFIPGNPPVVEIAFKASMINNDAVFVWWVWAQQNMNPKQMDYHDAIKHMDAGDVYLGLPYYPSNEIYQVDNTCRALWGAPTGEDPSLCVNDPYVPHPTPGSGTPTFTPPANLTRTATIVFYTGTPTSPSNGSQTATFTFTPSLTYTPSPTFTSGGCKDEAGNAATCTPTPTLRTPVNPTPTPTEPCGFATSNNPCTPTATEPCAVGTNNPCTPTPTKRVPNPTQTPTATKPGDCRDDFGNTCTPTPTPCGAAAACPTDTPAR